MDLNEIQNGLFRLARQFREQGQEVLPTVFFFGPAGMQVFPLTMPKSMWRTAILEGIRRFRAHTIVLHTEAWVVMGPEAPAAIAAKMAGLDSLEQWKGRREVLQSRLESADGTCRELEAEIRPDGTLGDTVERDLAGAGMTGELVGFFRRR